MPKNRLILIDLESSDETFRRIQEIIGATRSVGSNGSEPDLTKIQTFEVDADKSARVFEILGVAPANYQPGAQSVPDDLTGLSVFFSYSHRDERLRDELDKHLSGLKRSNLIRVWHDRRIAPGSHVDKTIASELESADLVLLLVSADFLASEYCYTREMKRAMERHDLNCARVLPIILRPVDWQNSPFAKLMALPRDGRPVTQWGRRDAAFFDVARGIRQVAEKLVSERSARSI